MKKKTNNLNYLVEKEKISMKNYFLYIVTLLFTTTALAQQKILLPKVTKITAKNMPIEVNYRQSQTQLAKMQKLLIIRTTIWQTK
jgi:hypothetical protein